MLTNFSLHITYDNLFFSRQFLRRVLFDLLVQKITKGKFWIRKVIWTGRGKFVQISIFYNHLVPTLHRLVEIQLISLTRSFDTSCSPTKFTQFLRSFPQRLDQKTHCEQSNAKQRLVVVMPLFRSSMLREWHCIGKYNPSIPGSLYPASFVVGKC